MKRRGNFPFFVFVTVVLLFSAGRSTTYADLNVYDADSQYLGVLLDYGAAGTWRLYVPAINRIISLSHSDNDENHADLYGPILFSTSDCTGIPFFPFHSRDPQHLVKDRRTNKYYIPKNGNVTVPPGSGMMYEYGGPAPGICSGTLVNLDMSGYVQYTEVGNPQIPFTTPVKLPLRFEYAPAIDINADGKTGLEEAIYSLQKAAAIR